MGLIETVAAPFRNEVVERARADAEEDISTVKRDLLSCDSDINKAAPYPSPNTSDDKFYFARVRHNIFHLVTVPDPAKGQQVSNGVDPYYVVVDEQRAVRFIAQRIGEVGNQFDEFIRRLTTKIGPVSQASLSRGHQTGTITLSVVTPLGQTQRWKCQRITNVSKNGKHFSQWKAQQLRT